MPAQVDARYQQVVDELLGELAADRQAWPAPRQAAFAEQLTALQQDVTAAGLACQSLGVWHGIPSRDALLAAIAS